jgi:hypothetical protein
MFFQVVTSGVVTRYAQNARSPNGLSSLSLSLDLPCVLSFFLIHEQAENESEAYHHNVVQSLKEYSIDLID